MLVFPACTKATATWPLPTLACLGNLCDSPLPPPPLPSPLHRLPASLTHCRSEECTKFAGLLIKWYEAMKSSTELDFEVFYVNTDKEEEAFKGGSRSHSPPTRGHTPLFTLAPAGEGGLLQ
jgi:hypothetical protein